MDVAGLVVFRLAWQGQRRLRAVDAIALREADVFELLGSEESLEFGEAASEVGVGERALGGGEFFIFGATRERLQRGET